MQLGLWLTGKRLMSTGIPLRPCYTNMLSSTVRRLPKPSASAPRATFHMTWSSAALLFRVSLGLVPPCLDQCTCMFVDPRALGRPICVLLLPPIPTAITSFLAKIHASYPLDLKLIVRGAPAYVQSTQLFIPGQVALITSSLERHDSDPSYHTAMPRRSDAHTSRPTCHAGCFR